MSDRIERVLARMRGGDFESGSSAAVEAALFLEWDSEGTLCCEVRHQDKNTPELYLSEPAEEEVFQLLNGLEVLVKSPEIPDAYRQTCYWAIYESQRPEALRALLRLVFAASDLKALCEKWDVLEQIGYKVESPESLKGNCEIVNRLVDAVMTLELEVPNHERHRKRLIQLAGEFCPRNEL